MVPNGYDDMFQHFDVERSPDLRQPLGGLDVTSAWRRISARMVVNENDRGGVELDCPPKNGARIKCDLSDRSVLQLFVGDQAS